MLLLEEPELSLHSALVSELPSVLAEARRSSKGSVQIFLSSHATEVVDDGTVNEDEVLVLVPSGDGTKGGLLSEFEGVGRYLDIGIPFSETIRSIMGGAGTPRFVLGS